MAEPSQSKTSSNENAAAPVRWRRELMLAAICLSLGLTVIPAVIYVVGVQLLGPYGGGPHIGSFYGDYFRDLLAGTGRTWFIVLAPYLLLNGLRLIFWPWGNKLPVSQPGPKHREPSQPRPDIAQVPATKERREPFVAP